MHIPPPSVVWKKDRGEWERWGQEGKGRNRVILKQWYFTRGLESSIVPRTLDKIRQSVRTRHKLKLRWGILLRNVEDNRPLFWYTNNPGSPWFSKLSETKDWLEALEESRLQGNVQRHNTKWVFDMAVSVDIKAILDRLLGFAINVKSPSWTNTRTLFVSSVAWRCLRARVQIVMLAEPGNSRKASLQPTRTSDLLSL